MFVGVTSEPPSPHKQTDDTQTAWTQHQCALRVRGCDPQALACMNAHTHTHTHTRTHSHARTHARVHTQRDNNTIETERGSALRKERERARNARTPKTQSSWATTTACGTFSDVMANKDILATMDRISIAPRACEMKSGTHCGGCQKLSHCYECC